MLHKISKRVDHDMISIETEIHVHSTIDFIYIAFCVHDIVPNNAIANGAAMSCANITNNNKKNRSK